MGEAAGDAARLRKGFLEFKVVASPGEGSLSMPTEEDPMLVGSLKDGRAGERFSRPMLMDGSARSDGVTCKPGIIGW